MAAPTKAPQRRRRTVTGVIVLVGVAFLALLLIAVRGSGDEEQTGEPVAQFVDVHGLGLGSSSALYLATHEGLIRRDGDGAWYRVSQEPHDFMGFAAVSGREGRFYASGHPAPRSRLSNPLGFMRSTDGGVTWENRSLEGEADFHTMAVEPSTGDVVYAWNGMGQAGLYRSDDGGENWDVLPAATLSRFGQPLALAVRPGDGDEVWAATEGGLVRSSDGGDAWEPLLEGAPVTAVAFDASTPGRVLVYAAAAGQGLLASDDDGQTWETVGWSLDDDAVAYLVIDPTDSDRLFAATFRKDVLASGDGGRTWTVLAREGVPQESEFSTAAPD